MLENPDQSEVNEIMSGMESVWTDFWKHVDETAPRCHFTPMQWHMAEEGESWWECRHCGHTKGSK